MEDAEPDQLTPVQRRTLELLGRGAAPVVFDTQVVDELRTDVDAGLAELAARLDPDGGDLGVTKHGLERVLTCETMWAADDTFTWTPARARGVVAHRAIQLSVHWPGDIVPTVLVDAAIERLGDEEKGISDWLRRLPPAEVADVRGRAVEHLSKFLECFPHLDGSWWPVTESSMQYPRRGPIVLRARVDLTLGRSTGGESRKVIIDVKTGRLHQRHREDLRFYALIETLARDVPPRLLATYSLDSGSPEREEVTTGLLRSALRRTLDAVQRMVELRHEERRAERRPGPACRWCAVRVDCAPGRTWLADADGDPDGG